MSTAFKAIQTLFTIWIYVFLFLFVQQLLVELGATIIEPSLCLGDDVTLTQATSTLQIYRGLSRPAYILNTQTDVFGHAFEMSARLRTLSVMWEDFGAEYEEMAKSVDVFAGEMLGQSSSTEEVGRSLGPRRHLLILVT